MVKYKIGLQKTNWLTIEADSFEEAVVKAKDKMAHYDFTVPEAYECVGGYKIQEDNE